jgi:lysophospholipase L1-like esterase
MAFSVLASNTTFPLAATPAVAQGLTLYDGWVETGNATNEILATGLVAQTSLIVTGYKDARLMRPMTEAKRNSKIVATYIAFAIGTPSILCYLRGNHETALFTGFIPFIAQDGTQFRLYPCVNGVLGTLVNIPTGTTTTIGQKYTLEVDCVQTNTTNTTLTFVLRNSVGTQIGVTGTTVNTTAALQNIAGVPGIGINANGVNPVGLGRFSAVATYQQPPVESTAYTVVPQIAGAVNIASSLFLLYPNNDGPFAPITITPSDNGGGGVFTPSSIAIDTLQTTPGSFRYTPGSAGVKTISYTNSASLANPGTTTFTATVYNIVSVLKGRFSPGNWKTDNGRIGTLWRKTWNIGAWYTYKWTASATPSASLLIEPNVDCTDTLSIYLNGVLTDGVPAVGNTTISGVVPSSVNILKVYINNSINNYRWNDGVNSVRVNGLLLDINSVEIDISNPRPWGIITGDSITQGVKANAGNGSFIHGYSVNILNMFDELGYDLSVNACSQVGWLVPGNGLGDVPAYYKIDASGYRDDLSRWNRIDETVSLLDSNGKISAYGELNQLPSFIIINLLTNDTGTGQNTVYVQDSIYQALIALRTAAPGAFIVLIVPCGIYDTSIGANINQAAYTNALKNAYNNYKSAYPYDGLVDLIDFGSDFARTLSRGIYTTDGIHPSALGHSLQGAKIIQRITTSLSKLFARWTYS